MAVNVERCMEVIRNHQRQLDADLEKQAYYRRMGNYDYVDRLEISIQSHRQMIDYYESLIAG